VTMHRSTHFETGRKVHVCSGAKLRNEMRC